MRIRLGVPDRHINEHILNAALETTTRANEALLKAGEAPSIEEAIRSGVRWKPERFKDGEHFDLASTVATRKWGDCDDLAPWRAAERRLLGDINAKAIAKRSGPNRFHAVVLTGDGQIEDPSKWAGMGHSVSGIGPAICGQIACVGESALAVVPYGNAWAARMDLPYGARHLSAQSLAASPELAAYHAARGASLVGESSGLLGEEDLESIAYLLNGLTGDPEDEAVVGFIDTILDVATKAAPVLSLVPGVGPVAAAAIPVASSLLSSLTKGKGGGPPPPPPPAAPGPLEVPQGGGSSANRGTFEVPSVQLPNGMSSFPIPGGGHVAYNPNTQGPSPIIVRF